MTNWRFTWWRDNAFRNSRGQLVANVDLFQDLEDAVDYLNDEYVSVQFWHVPRGENDVADRLANAGVLNRDVDAVLRTYFG